MILLRNTMKDNYPLKSRKESLCNYRLEIRKKYVFRFTRFVFFPFLLIKNSNEQER